MPTAPALPAGSTLGHSYEYGVRVNIGTTETPTWQDVRRISDVQPAITPITEDAATYDDFGSPNADKTGENWTLTFSALVNRVSSTGALPAEIAAILARTKPSAKGSAAELEVQYFHKPESGTPDPDDAYQGTATVGIQRANTGNSGVEKITVTLTGKGPRAEITNPFSGWGAAIPTITAITPASAVAGDQVQITGSGFSGATDVDFDTEGTPTAADFFVVGDATIIAIVPAGSAGDVGVSVTNATGESSDFTYTRGA